MLEISYPKGSKVCKVEEELQSIEDGWPRRAGVNSLLPYELLLSFRLLVRADVVFVTRVTFESPLRSWDLVDFMFRLDPAFFRLTLDTVPDGTVVLPSMSSAEGSVAPNLGYSASAWQTLKYWATSEFRLVARRLGVSVWATRETVSSLMFRLLELSIKTALLDRLIGVKP